MEAVPSAFELSNCSFYLRLALLISTADVKVKTIYTIDNPTVLNQITLKFTVYCVLPFSFELVLHQYQIFLHRYIKIENQLEIVKTPNTL